MNKGLFCIAMLLGVPSLASAQPDLQSAPAHAPISAVSYVPRDRAEGLIKLDVVVTDSEGKPVSGLQQADFNLAENGQPQNILSFQAFHGRGAGTEPPVKIILLIDTIELPSNLALNERLAVEAYLRKDGGHLARPVSLFLLSDTGLWTVRKPSSDGNTLVHEIEHNEITAVRRNKGWQRGSAPTTGDLKDPASESGLKALAQIATDERRQPGRKLLLWVGPGWGIGSGAYADAGDGSEVFGTARWFSALLREAHLALYSFSVGETSPEGQLYKAYLGGVSSPHKATSISLDRKVLACRAAAVSSTTALTWKTKSRDASRTTASFTGFPSILLRQSTSTSTTISQSK
jgi:VWFA-related protein